MLKSVTNHNVISYYNENGIFRIDLECNMVTEDKELQEETEELELIKNFKKIALVLQYPLKMWLQFQSVKKSALSDLASINVPPELSKVVERILESQLRQKVNSNILMSSQYGFLQDHRCTTAPLQR